MTAAAMASDVAQMCDRVERELLKHADNPPTGVSVTKLYPKAAFLEAIGASDEAWRSLRKKGLKVAKVGNQVVVSGTEFARWVAENQE